ncbi:aminoacyl-tRNA hydrolase [Flavobacterium rakeshii]|uniref:Aminoacyl-tRNA hydrolase n=1 Tax=Flavobacterium rakeshii TaxID=1038845 RepID=A0A6N8HGD8_9FLAO|nr:alternative ribosome rescue aminoacyl-tRNA hydrolase ArfB [Flavobacterium rakeshii]MEE1897657.1 alternative ribosome rescue aminoacyl-tRNA hydrolase ArfB [Flavobacterium rakeshii]MUV04751.1 aminoacyl-tRNA hydrolase [Flavobacterium rakeshii]
MNKQQLLNEPEYKAVRSSGAGGQNVNKVSSKVILSFDLNNSQAFTEEEKELLNEKLSSRLNTKGTLILQCDEDRSQIRNKQLVTKRFIELIETALQQDKPRIATKIPKAVIKKRLENKRRQAEKKQSRKKFDY